MQPFKDTKRDKTRFYHNKVLTMEFSNFVFTNWFKLQNYMRPEIFEQKYSKMNVLLQKVDFWQIFAVHYLTIGF